MRSVMLHKRYRIFWCLLWIIACFFSTTPAFAATVDGFVTQVKSPTEFYLGSLHVTMNEKTQCETQELHSNIQWKTKSHALLFGYHYFVLQNRPDSDSSTAVTCNHFPLKIGLYAQITGDMEHRHSDVLPAAQVTIYAVQIRQKISRDWSHHDLAGGAILEEAPKVHRSKKGWSGTLWLDGYPLCMSPEYTTLLSAPAGTKMSYQAFGLLSLPRMGAILTQSRSPAFSPLLFQPNTLATYRGMTLAGDKCGILYRTRLWPNQVDAKEEAYITSLAPAIHDSGNSSHIPESVSLPHLRGDNTFKILPNQNVQDFISRIGTSLIPPYQKTLAETDPTKIHFLFYVVQSDEKIFDYEIGKIDHFSQWLRPSWDEAALAFPNGVILVPEHTLVGIKNEAQLASILSGAIASVLQKQSYIARYAHPDDTFELSFDLLYLSG